LADWEKTHFAMELRVGNKFRLGRKIGSGSFGDIYIGEKEQYLHEQVFFIRESAAGGLWPLPTAL
jgi:hypothetical protein